MEIRLRHAEPADFDEVAQLIYDSTNHWYEAAGKPAIFTGPAGTTRLFCEVYEELDPGRCLVAVDETNSTIAGSCFYHPRETHVSLGIMNSHPQYSGRGIARRMLEFILAFAKQRDQPLRLVSSAMNLDSFSLYNRAGLAPYAVFQDMILQVPGHGIPDADLKGRCLRDAKPSDVRQLVELEQQVLGIRRPRDFEYFIENRTGDWHVSVLEEAAGRISGFLVSISHVASNMLGPGCALDDAGAIALIHRELNYRRGRTMVWLVPADRPTISKAMYSIGARNCEIHLGQSTGVLPETGGVVMPTFMPETA